jgi:hypothetical protein
MCGLVGIAGDLSLKDEQTMKRLLIFDYFRGPDSTGFAGIEHGGKANIAKIASHPVNLFYDVRFRDALKGPSSKVFMGHNRLATKGGINDNNAHPFHYGDIVGMHNGTLESRDKYALEEVLGKKFDVDSQALFAAIAELGVENVIPMLHAGDLSANSSAWALVWYDQKDGTLNFLRNQFRPLWYGFEEGFKRLLWGSEWEIIDSAISTGGTTTKVFVEPKTNYKYWPFDENVHYKFDVNELKKGGNARPKPRCKSLKGKEPVTASTGTTGANPFGRQSMGFHGTSSSTGNGSTTNYHGKSHKHTPGKTKEPVSFLHLMGDIGSPFAGWISPSQFEEWAKYGCSWCAQDLTYTDPGNTVFDREGIILCPGCSGYTEEDRERSNPTSRVYVKGSQIDAMNL